MSTQSTSGGWPTLLNNIECSIVTTAVVIHALAMAQPRGWQQVVKRAQDWLWSKQDKFGCWSIPRYNNIYLTVLVLDAIELASGGSAVTFTLDRRDKEKLISTSPQTTEINITVPQQELDKKTVKRDIEPSQSTMLNYWTIDDENVLKISTVTNGEKEGEVSFCLFKGEITKQRILMELLIERRSVKVLEIINSCYSKEKAALTRNNYADMSKLLTKVRSLVSDIRTKLNNNGINKDIISTLGQNADDKSKVNLNVNSINNLPEKHFKSKNITSYKPPDELSTDIDHNNNTQTNELNSYDPDKYIDGLDDDIEV